MVGGWVPGEALLRGPWAQWQKDPAKELSCDKSDSQPYFYSSINLIGRRRGRRRREKKKQWRHGCIHMRRK